MINDMGRPKTVFLDLPPRMTARKLRKGTVLYYYSGGGKKLPLGADLNKARLKWAELENGGAVGTTGYCSVADRWESEEVGKRSTKTQAEYLRALKCLRPAFKEFMLDQIQPMHVRKYLDQRSAKVAGNREISVLSAIWNWAREVGLTDKANPCQGVRRNKEAGRDRYVTKEEFDAVYLKACPELQDAMDLAYLTSQRPSDILGLTRQDIQEGHLCFKQGKTGKKLRIRIGLELQSVLDRILARPRAVQTMFLISGSDGQRLSTYQLRHRFYKAGAEDWQFRDLRAKAVTDEEDLRTASRRAGHADEKITASVYRRVKGDSVDSLK